MPDTSKQPSEQSLNQATHFIQWGELAIDMRRPVFSHGYADGRRFYFTEEAEVARHLTDSDILTLIAFPGKTRHYRLDRHTITFPKDALEEAIGVLVGYLSAPFFPESDEEREARMVDYRPPVEVEELLAAEEVVI